MKGSGNKSIKANLDYNHQFHTNSLSLSGDGE